MTEISKRLNELQEAEAELALVTPFADEYPEYYQAAYDAWEEAKARYEEALSEPQQCEPGPLWCEAEDALDDDEDYDDTPACHPPAPPAPPVPEANHVSGDAGVVDIGEDQGAAQEEEEVYGPDNPFRLEDLTRDAVPDWLDVSEDEYYEFKQDVYRECVRRASNTRAFVFGIPEARRDTLRRQVVHEDIVDDGERLMQDAEEALSLAQAQGDEAALSAQAPIELASTYRDADNQFDLWNGRFTATYVTRHRTMLQSLSGDPLSNEWVTKLAKKIGAATATPGYSYHQRGIAMDFRNPDHTIRNEKTDTAMARWRDTWFYTWLVANAATYGFEPYDGEAWHWNYTALMDGT